MRKLLSLLAVFNLFFASVVGATTYTAASNAESDVQAAINLTVNGDTVQVPCSGTQTVTWNTGLVISTNITLTALGATPNTGALTTGAGTNCLTIIQNTYQLFNVSATYNAANNVVTIQNFNIDPNTSSTTLGTPIVGVGTCTLNGCPNWRIDNIYFGKANQYNLSYCADETCLWKLRSADMFGVVDHNTDSGPNSVFYDENNPSYLGVGDWGDNSWAAADSMGTANEVYVENNSLTSNYWLMDGEKSPKSIGGNEDNGGGRYVGRFNVITLPCNGSTVCGAFGEHGTDTSGRGRSGRHQEVYANTLNCAGTNNCGGVGGGRGGTGIIFGNALSGRGSNSFGASSIYRLVFDSSGFSSCGGLNNINPFDTNDNVVYLTGTVGSVSASGGQFIVTDNGNTLSSFYVPGDTYEFYDTTQSNPASTPPHPPANFMSEIQGAATHTLTIDGPISESGWSAPVAGDSYEIIRASVCMEQTGRGQGNLLQVTNLSVNQSSGASGNLTTYTGTITNGAANALVGAQAQVIGFSNGGNNTGGGIVTASTATTITIYNPSGVSQSGQSGTVTIPTLVSSGVPGPVNDVLDPFYEWDNTAVTRPNADFSQLFAKVIANQDWYSDGWVNYPTHAGPSGPVVQTSPTAPFNGTTTCNASSTNYACGMGFGTLANRPTTCTAGVGYWATDQGTWNTSTKTYAGGYTEGELFTCGAGNVWSLHYVPYTYPHPLTGGVQPPPPTPSPTAAMFAGTQVKSGAQAAAQ